jgi:hypothetical protein
MGRSSGSSEGDHLFQDRAGDRGRATQKQRRRFFESTALRL